ncbi:hypothetical protein KJZ99_05095 [bacterium]|nr:hypothetical protein [bacterium]
MRVALLGLILIFSGCAHTLVIEKSSPPERYLQANHFLHDRTATVKLRTGSDLRVTDLHIGRDTTVFSIDGQTDKVLMMNERIRAIATRDRANALRNGALAGGMVGSVVGFFVGALVAAIDPQVRYSEPSGLHGKEENDLAVILEGVGIGAGVGAFSGGLLGSQLAGVRCVEYHLDPKDPRRWEYLPR